MGKKEKMFSLRIASEFLDEYREFCDENSINISRRLRKYMERDLELWRKKKEEKRVKEQNNNSQNP